MPDDTHPASLNRLAIAVLKNKAGSLPARPEVDHVRDVPVMVPRQYSDFARIPEPIQQCLGRLKGRTVMDQVAGDNELARLIIGQQFREAVFNRGHPPERDQAAGGPLA